MNVTAAAAVDPRLLQPDDVPFDGEFHFRLGEEPIFSRISTGMVTRPLDLMRMDVLAR